MHQKTMKSQIAQAERLKNAQAGNIDALFDCDIKQVDDEYKVSAQSPRALCSSKTRHEAPACHLSHVRSPRRRCFRQAQLEFFQSRLIDSLEQKHRKLARQAGFRIGRRPSETGKTLLSDAKRKKMTGACCLIPIWPCIYASPVHIADEAYLPLMPHVRRGFGQLHAQA